MPHYDVVIVGAGLSGIGAAWHLQDKCPTRTYTILEARAASGGTWDLFRYPGVRSDSDMFTLGYAFRPWAEAKAIADGPSILSYVRDTAAEAGIDNHIRFSHAVRQVEWSSENATWTVTAEVSEPGVASADADTPAEQRETQFTCNFLYMCSGYYNYESGYEPAFPGRESFAGTVVHPQKWPDDLDYAGKRVVVIGSGATAVTVVPAMAKTAAHVTMLQRSPTWVVSMPGNDEMGARLRRFLPASLVYAISRWQRVLFGMLFFALCRHRPGRVRAMLLRGVRSALGPDFDVDRHFTPAYNPWDQRLCLVPDGDLFESLTSGQASVVTDTISHFDAGGIHLDSGEYLEAEVVVSATGLRMQLLSDIRVLVDGEAVNLADTMIYKGMMFSDVPNLAFAMGYTNASWTLKADLTSEYVCRLLNHMSRHGYAACRAPRNPAMATIPLIDFSSGYVQRAADLLPKQGVDKPWRLYQNYVLDTLTLGFGAVEDGVMQFDKVMPQRVEKLRELTASFSVPD